MEFLKELFNGGALTYEQLAAAVKGIRFPNDVVEAVEQAIQGKIVPFPHLSLPLFVPRWRT